MSSSAAGRRPRRPFLPMAGSSTRSSREGNDPGNQPRVAGFSTRPRLHADIPAGNRHRAAVNDLLQVGDADWHEFWATIAAPRTLAACRLSFVASFVAALVNSVFGTVVAWT